MIGSCLLAPHAAAASSTVTGHSVPDDTHTLTFLSELSQMDICHDFYYSDRFFDHSATEYDHALALASLGMAVSAFNSASSNQKYWVNADVGREDNLAATYEELGFADTAYHNYDVDTGSPRDTVGYGFARKTLVTKNARTTIVSIAFRGGGYGGEWVGNLHTGEGKAHFGFITSINDIFETFCSYLSHAMLREDLGTVKLWIVGYSRGGIIANLMAARIHNELPQLAQENIFVYTFAAPTALTADVCPELRQDFDNNHLPNGTLKSTWSSSNIFNILSSGDLVPRILPGDWGYYRNGNDRFLPATRNKKELADLDEMGTHFSPPILVFSQLATAEDATAVIESMRNFFVSKENFHEKYENALMDMIACVFLRSEAEVTEGAILSDEEIVERLLSLNNMKQFSWLQVIRNVLAASTISRPLLAQYGSNVPVRIQQVIIPMIAVGLCYGVETNLIQMIAGYVISLLSVRTNPDNLLRAAYCHHIENYISLMEYYAPEEHGLQPFTRK